jgi:hypothetical protein
VHSDGQTFLILKGVRYKVFYVVLEKHTASLLLNLREEGADNA